MEEQLVLGEGDVAGFLGGEDDTMGAIFQGCFELNIVSKMYPVHCDFRVREVRCPQAVS